MSDKQYKNISEVSELLKIQKHVIRYWDSRFEGISTRLGSKKRRFFSIENIKKIKVLKNMLHTNNKSHHSLELARKILDKKIVKGEFSELTNNVKKNLNVQRLLDISNDLKKLL